MSDLLYVGPATTKKLARYGVHTIGNSTTAPRDLSSDDDVKITLYSLCESVAARLRAQATRCATVKLGIRDTGLLWYERQTKLSYPTCSSTDIFQAAYQLFKGNPPPHPIRSLSVRASSLSPFGEGSQLSLFPEEQRSLRHADLETTLDKIREKYGYLSIQRGIMHLDPKLNIDAQHDNTIHPIGFLGTLS